MPKGRTKVFVGMSGGVDSSVAAYLLKKQGYDVVGVFMHSYNLDGCEERDAEDARRVAEKLQIPFYVMDFEKEYKQYVVEYMIDGYKQGITPNPDVMCNKEIKFGFFLKKALELGADYVATGHYVQLRRRQSTLAKTKTWASPRRRPEQGYSAAALFAARDMQKDQSYFLWTLTQNQLKHCLFPIGDYLKSEVRAIAKRAGLPTASKKDSQGICFLGKVTLADFLKEHIPAARGTVVNENGEVIGEHDGANFYTIGQRHGFTARSRRSEAGIKSDQRPHYIVQKNAAANTLVAVEGDDHPALYRKEIELGKVNLIDPALIDRSTNNQLTVWARVRYRQPLAKAMLVRGEDGTKIIFEKPQKFVAPGQSAVFYRTRRSRGGEGYEMLGGGVIAN